MFEPESHPLYGKETTCHRCDGLAVWVFNGSAVGNYHFCRVCKIETGPFAKDIQLPKLEEAPKETLNDWGVFFASSTLVWQQLEFDLTGDEEGLIGCQDDGDCEVCEGAD